MMIKKQPSPLPAPDALPARFTINPEAFAGMTAATLKMPYAEPLWQFEMWLKEYFKRNQQPKKDESGHVIRPKPPYRLLNDALTACAPTIVHGFEWSQSKEGNRLQMLAVGKPVFDDAGNVTGSDLAYPTEDQITDVMRLWLRQWGERPWLKNIIEGEGQAQWQALSTALSEPSDTFWDLDISPTAVLEKMDGLAYDVIPSLIATLLHGTSSCIGPHRKTVHWRRMQEANTKRYCVVSLPLPVEFLKQNKSTGDMEEKSGYFSYKIEIALQTQAGRKLPWLYLSLHCMRYAHLPLSFNKRDNEVTVLVRANEARLQNWKVDSTLVRLKATPRANAKNRDRVMWLDDLPVLLADLKARPLIAPGALYEAPLLYWRKPDESAPPDEYYVLHTEGYRYKDGKKHPVLTGFSLLERAEVLGSLCNDVLRDVLTADAPMQADTRRFEDHNKPAALRTFTDLAPNILLGSLSKQEREASSQAERDAFRLERVAVRDAKKREQERQNQPLMLEALQRATRGKTLVIACFHREADTLDVLKTALRDALQLNSDEAYPPQVVVLTPLIPSPEMVQPLEEIGDASRSKAEVTTHWRDRKIAEWHGLLQETFGDYLTRADVTCAAVVELDKKTHIELTPPRRSIHSVIRETCARQNVLSQMIVTPKRLVNVPKIDSETKGKAQQTIQDLTSRQTGAIYGPPADLYEAVGLDDFGGKISAALDVIALSFCATTTGARYCLATRLRADGAIDVLLPEPDADWMAYVDAGPCLGRIFARQRSAVKNGKIGNAFRGDRQSQARLTVSQINGFVEALLTKRLERPTVVIVEAEKWRSTLNSGGNWWQLQNNCLSEHQQHLVFGSRYDVGEQNIYKRGESRNDSSTHNLALGIVRLRASETPQYITNRGDWRFDDETLMRNYFDLTGFIDRTTTEVFHYFSVGKLPAGAGQPQRIKNKFDPFKIVNGSQSGGGVAYRHPAMIEMVPFFVHPDFASDEGKAALCRIPHYLRVSPAWAMGNLDSPYPLHLGDTLLQDQLCILGLGDD